VKGKLGAATWGVVQTIVVTGENLLKNRGGRARPKMRGLLGKKKKKLEKKRGKHAWVYLIRKNWGGKIPGVGLNPPPWGIEGENWENASPQYRQVKERIGHGPQLREETKKSEGKCFSLERILYQKK